MEEHVPDRAMIAAPLALERTTCPPSSAAARRSRASVARDRLARPHTSARIQAPAQTEPGWRHDSTVPADGNPPAATEQILVAFAAGAALRSVSGVARIRRCGT
jgi:hypothetical protein